MKKLLLLSAILLVAACNTVKNNAKAPVASTGPTMADVTRGAQKYPGLTLANLNDGKTAFESSCEKCHGLDRSTSATPETLENVMPEMAGKAHIDTKTSELILKYLNTMKMGEKK